MVCPKPRCIAILANLPATNTNGMSIVDWAADSQAAAIEDMGVDHCRAHIFVAKQLLHRADIVAIFQQVGGE